MVCILMLLLYADRSLTILYSFDFPLMFDVKGKMKIVNIVILQNKTGNTIYNQIFAHADVTCPQNS